MTFFLFFFILQNCTRNLGLDQKWSNLKLQVGPDLVHPGPLPGVGVGPVLVQGGPDLVQL